MEKPKPKARSWLRASVPAMTVDRKVTFENEPKHGFTESSLEGHGDFQCQVSPSNWSGIPDLSRKLRKNGLKTMLKRLSLSSGSSDETGSRLKYSSGTIAGASKYNSDSGVASFGSRGSFADLRAVKLRLEEYREPHVKTPQALEFLKSSIRKHRVRALLQDADIDMIADRMEFYNFEAQQVVAKEGEAETHFFVVETGGVHIKLGNGQEDSFMPGRAFGSSALLYRCLWNGTITAMEKSGLWGIQGETFQQVLRQRAQSRSRDDHRSVHDIELFNGLTVEQCDLITRALEPKTYVKGSIVVSKGKPVTPAMYYVKSGLLQTADGDMQFKAGDSFGERVLLDGEVWPSTVVVLEKCDILKIEAAQLRPVLSKSELKLYRDDSKQRTLRELLEQCIVTHALRQGPVCSQYTRRHQEKIAQSFEIVEYTPGQQVGSDVQFVVVISGSLVGTTDGAKLPSTLRRGEWSSYLSEELKISTLRWNKDDPPQLRRAAAGPQGARLGILTKDGLASAISAHLKINHKATTEEVQDYTRKLVVVKKLPILSNYLSQEQMLNLVKKFKNESKSKGTCVIEQGTRGTAFYVIVSGEVVVTINGKEVRTLGTNAYFGERALLFDEPRTATIKISSSDADLWSLDKTTFAEVVTEKMRQELMRRIQLQDTKVSLPDLRVVRSIGEGISGVVRLVEHRGTGMRYALKGVFKANDQMVKDLNRECALLRENNHPFVMDVVKTFETSSRIYMLTELLTGGDMHGAIRTIPTTLSRAQAQFYAGSLVIVLEALWDRKIVYRDLKPENVMLDTQGYIKLIDFGISKKLGDGEPRTFTTVGTPHYMAPEVMSSTGYGNSADLWSLGVILFEFVCGCLPFANDLETAAEIFTAVLKGELSFPDTYRDQACREIIKGLLCFDQTKRLGVGVNGYEELKSASFFQLHSGDQDLQLFNKIMGRELTAPVIPKGEIFAEDEDEEDEEDEDEDSHLTDLSDDVDIMRSPSGKFERISKRHSNNSENNKAPSSGALSCCPCLAFLFKSKRTPAKPLEDEEEDESD